MDERVGESGAVEFRVGRRSLLFAWFKLGLIWAVAGIIAAVCAARGLIWPAGVAAVSAAVLTLIIWPGMRRASGSVPALRVSNDGLELWGGPLRPWHEIEAIELSHRHADKRSFDATTLTVLPRPPRPGGLGGTIDRLAPPDQITLQALRDPEGAVAALAARVPPSVLAGSRIDPSPLAAPLLDRRDAS